MRLVSTRAAAEHIGLTTRTISAMLADGRLTRYRLEGGRTVRVDLDELMSLFQAQR